MSLRGLRLGVAKQGQTGPLRRAATAVPQPPAAASSRTSSRLAASIPWINSHEPAASQRGCCEGTPCPPAGLHIHHRMIESRRAPPAGEHKRVARADCCWSPRRWIVPTIAARAPAGGMPRSAVGSRCLARPPAQRCRCSCYPPGPRAAPRPAWCGDPFEPRVYRAMRAARPPGRHSHGACACGSGGTANHQPCTCGEAEVF